MTSIIIQIGYLWRTELISLFAVLFITEEKLNKRVSPEKQFPINIHFRTKLWVFQYVLSERKHRISFLRIKCSLLFKTLTLLHLRVLCANLKLVHWLWIRIFLRFLNFVKIYVIIKRAWPFIWLILNPLPPRISMLCVKFGWIY